MSDHAEHVEPEPPDAEELSHRLFLLGNIGVLGFIAVVFIFIL